MPDSHGRRLGVFAASILAALVFGAQPGTALQVFEGGPSLQSHDQALAALATVGRAAQAT